MSFLSYVFSAEVAETEDKEFCAWEWEKKKKLYLQMGKITFLNCQEIPL